MITITNHFWLETQTFSRITITTRIIITNNFWHNSRRSIWERSSNRFTEPRGRMCSSLWSCVCVLDAYVCEYFVALFLATRLMRVHHISNVLWELDLIDRQIGVPKLSMPWGQSMWLVCELPRLVTCVAPSVVGLFPANPQLDFPRSANSNSIKNIRK